MKILIIGSGGREHAIVWALKKTGDPAAKIYCASGNAGIAQLAQITEIPASDRTRLVSFARTEGIDLTFVGPEAPLVAGLVDDFESAGLPIVGPHAAAARLEGSKVFAKDFMARHSIPTAAYRSAETAEDAVRHLRSGEFGSVESSLVVKADGLAAGKGVIVAGNHAEAESAIRGLMIDHVAGSEAANRIVLEEALEGVEASLLLFADGKDYVLMPAARDHKRIGEGDTGPNTGGMGSITDPSVLDDAQLGRVLAEIVEPTLEGARAEGFPFKGVLFLGLMLTVTGPKLLEYNVRFGDPETQAILVRLNTDLLAIFDSVRQGTLGRLRVDWTEGASACVVAANRGYPGKYESGAVISGLESFGFEDVEVFHAGTSRSSNGELLATGGRVLGVTSAAKTLEAALGSCYSALEKIHWSGMQFRRDIGKARPALGTAV
jgi:phosphoribosylamine--glycine ligase